ncbi:MAG: tyrosine-type recombinase/integrase [Polyangiales bacterium]
MDNRPIGHVDYVEGKLGTQGHYVVRVRLLDGTRPYIHCDPSPRSPTAERAARRKAEGWTERAREQEVVRAATPAAPAMETVKDWFDRYFEYRDGKGQRSVKDSRSRFANWIAPAIGRRPMAEVTADELETIVALLDDAVDQERISWKTAHNIWGEVTAAFGQACRSKKKDLRVRKDNPVDNVPGPDRGTKKQQPILYPDEVVTLLACEAVPVHWRVMYAVAVYTGARAGELAALSASDVDVLHRRLSIARQRDRETGELRLTKTKAVRAFDIEDAILPLVERLVAARPTGALLRLPVDEHRASLLREHLRRAGVARQELYVERDPTRMPFTFHGLRHTHLTWMAVRGDDSVKIQMRAGHTDFKMTQRYIEAARTLGGGFGTPFPALPARLVTGPLGARGASALTPEEIAVMRTDVAERAEAQPARTTARRARATTEALALAAE